MQFITRCLFPTDDHAQKLTSPHRNASCYGWILSCLSTSYVDRRLLTLRSSVFFIMQLSKDIGLQPFVSILSFPFLGMGMTNPSFHRSGKAPVCHTRLIVSSRANSPISGTFLGTGYIIPSGPVRADNPVGFVQTEIIIVVYY